ncbi:hypothetical protein [Lebetimonas sp. JH292]|uniref:hypothetical protein n=1 Tax=Lebetimonas sp. JH292 TaxID=990068 RepID=UPI001F1A9735|nr:hypothetical protein [Lebetimonas sp. JH292]
MSSSKARVILFFFSNSGGLREIIILSGQIILITALLFIHLTTGAFNLTKSYRLFSFKKTSFLAIISKGIFSLYNCNFPFSIFNFSFISMHFPFGIISVLNIAGFISL